MRTTLGRWRNGPGRAGGELALSYSLASPRPFFQEFAERMDLSADNCYSEFQEAQAPPRLGGDIWR